VLTLLITALATAYFVVPELLSRFVLDFFFVRKNLAASKREDIVRAAFWAVVPLSIAWCIRRTPILCMPEHSRENAKAVFCGLYSEKAFSDDPQKFFHAITLFARANFCLLSRTYLIVIIGSLLLGWVTNNFGLIRLHIKRFPRISKFLHWLILPRISEWHLALSTMLLTDPKQYCIEVDVLTGNGILYRGSVQEKNIGSDGVLQSLLLTSPERFKRPEFMRDRTAYETDKNGHSKPDTAS